MVDAMGAGMAALGKQPTPFLCSRFAFCLFAQRVFQEALLQDLHRLGKLFVYVVTTFAAKLI